MMYRILARLGPGENHRYCFLSYAHIIRKGMVEGGKVL